MIIQKINYILQEIDAPIGFKAKYMLEKIIKLPFVILKQPLSYLFHEDYILKNRDGIWKIKAHSDFDYAVASYHEPELEPLFRNTDGICFDIGAHVGKWSIYLAKMSEYNQVYAFEPNPETFKYLVENIKLNGLNNVFAYNIGTSSQKGIANFTATSMAAMSHIDNKDSLQINTLDLDSFIQENRIEVNDIKLIKIDVEGHEFEVLIGMQKTLEKLSNDVKIICEVTQNKDKLLEFMQERGYFGILTQTGQDYLFVKRD